LGPLQRVNLNHWTTYVGIVTAIKTPETGLSQWQIARKIYNKYCDTASTDLKLREKRKWKFYTTNPANKPNP
jgi:hypothetical protein